MANIPTEENAIDSLIINIKNQKIYDKINVDYINNLFEIIDNERAIPIEYYNKTLYELAKPYNKRCDLKSCSRKAQYTDSVNNYCWIHCQYK